MSDRAARLSGALALAAGLACSGAEEKVVNNYFNAVRAQDNQTLSSFAAVTFNEPVESWEVVSSRDEAASGATLPQLAARVKDLEAQLAANKKDAGAYHAQRWAEIQKVTDLKQKGGVVPAALTSVAGEWDKFNSKDRELKKQLAAAKAEMEKERRAVRLSVGDMEGVEGLEGQVESKVVEVNVTSRGQKKPYLMTLRKYNLKRDQGGRMMSRWVVQDLKPKG